MKTLLIDDEKDARLVMSKLLTTYCPNIVIVGVADSVQTGVQQIRQEKPDVVFLDIQLRDGTGFDLLDFFPNPDFQVVFTTAFDTFALRAFRYHAADYLLKPVAPTELSNTVERLKNQIFSPREQLLESLKNSFKVQKVDRIAISTAEGITFLEVAHILRLESDGNYTTFFTEQGEVIIASRGISDFEDLLPNSDFCRVHQSHVVQLRHVRKFLKEDGGYALMSNGHKIPVSRRKKDVFLNLLMKGKG